MKFARFSIALIYIWFAVLKLAGLSPAEPMVHALYTQTLSFVPFDIFYIAFSIFECIIGILFLFPKKTSIVFFLFSAHIIMTTLPLFLLPDIVWRNIFVPTFEGQYIIKNIALVALALLIFRSQRAQKV